MYSKRNKSKTIGVIVALLTLGVLGVLARTAFVQIKEPTQEIQLYYYNPQNDLDENGNVLCSTKGLSAVPRSVKKNENTIENAINLLLEGHITEEEKERGISTEYPLNGLKLTGVKLQEGVLTLTFEDPYNKTSGGSCRVGILWEQIKTTALQFDTVKEVYFQPEWLFQP